MRAAVKVLMPMPSPRKKMTLRARSLTLSILRACGVPAAVGGGVAQPVSVAAPQAISTPAAKVVDRILLAP